MMQLVANLLHQNKQTTPTKIKGEKEEKKKKMNNKISNNNNNNKYDYLISLIKKIKNKKTT